LLDIVNKVFWISDIDCIHVEQSYSSLKIQSVELSNTASILLSLGHNQKVGFYVPLSNKNGYQQQTHSENTDRRNPACHPNLSHTLTQA
jgi:hypothetical protein